MELFLLGAAAALVVLWKSNTFTNTNPAVVAQANNRLPVQGATTTQKPKQQPSQPSKSSGSGISGGSSGAGAAQQAASGRTQHGTGDYNIPQNLIFPNFGEGISCSYGKCNCGTCSTPPCSGVETIGATPTQCSTSILQNDVLFNCSRYTNVAGPGCATCAIDYCNPCAWCMGGGGSSAQPCSRASYCMACECF